MANIKSHKTVEQIAKKHRLDVSFIQKQLDIGEPIEHEHTKDHDLAKNIALQHLDEIPDYYTRLKKMEASAKKEHNRKFKDVKEHCGCEEDGVKELETNLKKLKNTSYDSIDKLMRVIMKKHNLTAKQLHNSFVDKHRKTPDEWIKQINEEGLRDWFGKSKSKNGKPGWVNVVTGGTCASDEPGEGVPKCVSSSKRASMSPSERLSASKRKKAADPNQQNKTGAAKPTYVSTDKPKRKMKEEVNLNEVKDKPGKGSGKKDACYHKVKSRYSVWPSAYASGALVKCRKVGADNWGTSKEEVELSASNEKRYCPKCRKEETRDECKYGNAYWDMFSLPSKIKEAKDHEYSMARSELSTVINAAKRLKKKMAKGEGNVEAWVQSKITKAADYLDSAADYLDSGEHDVNEEKNPCWKGYKKVGMKKKGKSIVPNCVPENVTIEDADGNTFAEIIDLIKPDAIKVEEATRLQSQIGNVIMTTLFWRGKYYSLKMFFPQTKIPSRQELADELQKIYPGCKLVSHSISEFTPGEPLVQAFGPQGGSFGFPGPSKNYVKTMGEGVGAWQRKEGKNPSGGLNEKGRKSYERENPGSDLKAPSKKVGNPRRASFCARMKGMKNKLTSAKTANDPNSRINKSLRAWNC